MRAARQMRLSEKKTKESKKDKVLIRMIVND